MLRKIKSLFVVEQTKVEKQTANPEPNRSVETTEQKLQEFEQGEGEVTKRSLDKFLKVLADAMESANIEGYDYLEFKQAVRSLENIEADEQKRYVTSFTLAQTMGAEKDSLNKSAGYYLEVLQKEELKFRESLKNQVESKLTVRKKMLDNLENQKQNKLAQIKKMQEEIEVIDQKSKRVQSEIEESSKKVASVQKSFQAAFDLIVNQIRDDLSKIEKYIK
jgi:archaellum component FlaC